MIDPKELRIGNWVSIPECAVHAKIKSIGQVTFSIYTDDIDLDKDNDYFNYNSANPISLSPELLEACGFVKSEGDFFKDTTVYSNKIRLYYHDNNDYSLYGYNDLKVYVFYLHELMNLFHLLTGEQLTVNLDKVKV